jgi:hypothetical protein
MFPVLKGLHSPDCEPPHSPADPTHCIVLIEADIGLKDEVGADIFSFVVVTPSALADLELPLWGRGYLVVKRFSWQIIETTLAKLLLQVRGDSWDEVSTRLSKELFYEFDNYKE